MLQLPEISVPESPLAWSLLEVSGEFLSEQFATDLVQLHKQAFCSQTYACRENKTKLLKKHIIYNKC